jgi:hypothetical protein
MWVVLPGVQLAHSIFQDQNEFQESATDTAKLSIAKMAMITPFEDSLAY